MPCCVLGFGFGNWAPPELELRGVLLESETQDEGWFRMKLLHVPALELGEDFEMGDEHSKKHGLLNNNFFP